MNLMKKISEHVRRSNGKRKLSEGITGFSKAIEELEDLLKKDYQKLKIKK